MTEHNNDAQPIEARLKDYGTILQTHLATGGGAEDADNEPGLLLVGGFGADQLTKASSAKPVAAFMSMAAALLVVMALIVPALMTDDSTDPITVTGPDLAGQSEHDDGTGEGKDGGDDKSLGEQGKPAVDDSGDGDETFKDTNDWSQFSVQLGDDDQPGDKDDHPVDDNAADGATTDSAVAESGDSEQDNDDTDKNESPCTDGAVERDGQCVHIGSPPTPGNGECPDEAVVLGSQCYIVVAPTCGDLETAPSGDGCLKLVGSAQAQGQCPSPYDLSEDGESCVRYKQASVTCSQGTPVGDNCLIEQHPVGGEHAGCADGQLQIGNQCYQLSSPTFDCGELSELPNGNCRYPVEPEHTTECPVGLQPWEDHCYRYEDPPTYDCAGGESDGSGWCHVIEDATPGPDLCDDGVSQDAQGCYVLVAPDNDGSCGEYQELEGMCRKPKPSYPTWTCSDGHTVYESTCDLWVEAVSVSCAAGQLVENNTKCKTIEDPISTTSCPSYALEDGGGCYKVKEPAVSCGELAVAPDGEQCKQWIGETDGSGAECSSGFELVGGTTCKKWIDGSPFCDDGEQVEIDGHLKCRFTTSVGDLTSGCDDTAIEHAGNCYKTVPASCGDLDGDIYGTGCKKPAGGSADLVCAQGYTLVEHECIKKA